MTRLGILADIHGNLPALEAVVSAMSQHNPDHVIVLGDLINGAPFDSEVVETVMHSNWSVIRGNHELYILNLNTPRARTGHTESDMLQWVSNNLIDWLPTLASLPDTITLTFRDGPLIRAEHGLPGNPNRALRQDSSPRDVVEALMDIPEHTYIHGHHHVPYARHVAEFHIIDPGSVGRSQNGVRKAYYAILDAAGDHWKAEQHSVDYDFGAVEDAIHEKGIFEIDDVLAYANLEELRRARPVISPFRDWYRTEYGEEATPTREDLDNFLLDKPTWWDFMREAYRVNKEAFYSEDVLT